MKINSKEIIMSGAMIGGPFQHPSLLLSRRTDP